MSLLFVLVSACALAAPARQCEQLANMPFGADVKIESATPLAAAANVPKHCDVRGVIWPEAAFRHLANVGELTLVLGEEVVRHSTVWGSTRACLSRTAICFTLEREIREPPMIEIHDEALENRLRKRIQLTGAASPEEALLYLLETQEEQDRWLMESREGIHAKIRRGIAQLDRGEGISEDELDVFLATHKAKAQ